MVWASPMDAAPSMKVRKSEKAMQFVSEPPQRVGRD
jgi:hypothetical protein